MPGLSTEVNKRSPTVCRQWDNTEKIPPGIVFAHDNCDRNSREWGGALGCRLPKAVNTREALGLDVLYAIHDLIGSNRKCRYDRQSSQPTSECRFMTGESQYDYNRRYTATCNQSHQHERNRCYGWLIFVSLPHRSSCPMDRRLGCSTPRCQGGLCGLCRNLRG